MWSFLKSAWQYRCPKCRNKNSCLFREPFDFKKPLDMPESCHVCGQLFEPEPGFYYGAMFISYLISTFLLLPLALLLVFYFGVSENLTMVIIIFIGVVLFFRILRMSRSLWIHTMVRYDPHCDIDYNEAGRDD